MSEEEYIEVEGYGTMAGEPTPMPVKLKNHFVDKGHWDDMSGQLKYIYALLDSTKRHLEADEGRCMTYRYYIEEHWSSTPEQSKELLSMLPE